MPKEKKREKKRQVDEAMVDQIIKERQSQKTWKEELYDRINIPIWLLDIIIALLVAALAYILIFKRTGA